MHGITQVGPRESVESIARTMEERGVGSVLMERPRGRYYILTERDIVVRVVAEGRDPREVKAEEVMTRLKYTIDSEATIEKSSSILNTHHIRRLPVMHNGEIAGIITARDIAKACSRL